MNNISRQINMFLDDLPRELPYLKVITVHGKGRGGGEVVVKDIQDIYKENNITLLTIPSSNLTFFDILAIKRTNKEDKNSVSILFTAGLRDIPKILLAKLLGIKIAIYLQVPYLKALTGRDPIYTFTTILSQFIFLLADKLFVNSKNSKIFFPKKQQLLLPIRHNRIINKKTQIFTDITKLMNKNQIVGITTSRLSKEHGLGSRDIDAIKQLNDECHKWNSKGKLPQIILYHFGDADDEIKEEITKDYKCIDFMGYNADWINFYSDFYFFFSNYEGFGLAAFEASNTGKTTFVNEVFPDEMLELTSRIYRISTKNVDSILNQMNFK